MLFATLLRLRRLGGPGGRGDPLIIILQGGGIEKSGPMLEAAARRRGGKGEKEPRNHPTSPPRS
jgi:hypothetical protein